MNRIRSMVKANYCVKCGAKIDQPAYLGQGNPDESYCNKAIEALRKDFCKHNVQLGFKLTNTPSSGEAACCVCGFPALSNKPITRIAIVATIAAGKTNLLQYMHEHFGHAPFISKWSARFTIALNQENAKIEPMNSSAALLQHCGHKVSSDPLSYDEPLKATDPDGLNIAPYIFDIKLNLSKTQQKKSNPVLTSLKNIFTAPNEVTVALFDQAGEVIENMSTRGLINQDQIPTNIDHFICLIDGEKLVALLNAPNSTSRQWSSLFAIPILLHNWGHKLSVAISKSDLLLPNAPYELRSSLTSNDLVNLTKHGELLQSFIGKFISLPPFPICAFSATGGAVPGHSKPIQYRIHAPLAQALIYAGFDLQLSTQGAS